MSKISCGANPSSMIMTYKDLIRAHLEWGCQFFANARRSNLDLLDRVQLAALRAILGWMKSTPTGILLSEVNQSPFALRRLVISKRHMLRNLAWSQNPFILKLQLFSEKYSITKRYRRGIGLLKFSSLVDTYRDKACMSRKAFIHIM